MQTVLKDVAVTSIAHNGSGIAKRQNAGKTLFIYGALPGQVVTCQIYDERKNFAYARLLEVKKNISLADALCPHQDICGGCPLQRLDYQEQLRWKHRLASENLVRIGKFNRDEIAQLFEFPLASPKIKHYRNKAELAFGEDANGQLILGFRKNGSHEVFNLEYCAAIPSEAFSIIHLVRDIARQSGFKAYDGNAGFLRTLTMRESIDPHTLKKQWSLIFLTSPAKHHIRKMAEKILEGCSSVISAIHTQRAGKDWLNIAEKRLMCLDSKGRDSLDAATICKQLCDSFFYIDAASFFQVNDGAGNLLGSLVKQMDFSKAQDAGILDLYCGSGAPGLLIAPNYAKITGIEADKAAIKNARKNAMSNPKVPENRWICGDVNRTLKSVYKDACFRTVLMDPPRAGISADALMMLMQINAARLIYISCNPATFARDAAILKKEYRLVRLAAADLFPHTAHLECISLWEKY